MPSAPHLDFAGRVRAATSLAVLHASKVDDVATARHAIREGKVDLVGMTRAHLADPHIVRKIIEGGRPRSARASARPTASTASTRPARRCASTTRRRAARRRCPTRSRAAPTARRVVVVGAGPGGLEAARVAGERGHDVTLLEAMPWAGGQIRLAARNPRRRTCWASSSGASPSSPASASTCATTSSPRRPTSPPLDPDVVIVATGGLPQLPELDEGDERMVTSWDVLGGDVTPTGDVLFFDDNGTHSAMSAAEMIARSGARLEIVTPERMLGIEVGGMNHVPYARAFNETDTRITLNQRVRAVRPEARAAVRRARQRPHRRTAACATSTGSSPTTARRRRAELYFELQAGVDEPRRRRLRARCSSGRPQSLTREPRRPVPAVPHRRRRRQPQHPRRRLRRAPTRQRPVGIRGFRRHGTVPHQTLG